MKKKYYAKVFVPNFNKYSLELFAKTIIKLEELYSMEIQVEVFNVVQSENYSYIVFRICSNKSIAKTIYFMDNLVFVSKLDFPPFNESDDLSYQIDELKLLCTLNIKEHTIYS